MNNLNHLWIYMKIFDNFCERMIQPLFNELEINYFQTFLSFSSDFFVAHCGMDMVMLPIIYVTLFFMRPSSIFVGSPQMARPPAKTFQANFDERVTSQKVFQ